MTKLSPQEVPSTGSLQNIPAEWEITSDSREDVQNKVFVCLSGRHHDGHDEATETIRRGARLAVTERDLGLADQIIVPDTRKALAWLTARHWGDPHQKLRMVGITGTNGKTTTAHILTHLLQSRGEHVGRIGTDGITYGDVTEPTPYTTPPPEELYPILHRMRQAGVTTVVMEVSSQALDQGRVEGILFDTAVFTNLTQDHLDYHRDIPHYFAAKAKLFTQCRTAVLNTADPYGRRLLDTVTVPMRPYHLPEQRLCRIGEAKMPWHGGELIIPMTGEVFLQDALAAAEAALALGLTPCEIQAAMPHCPAVTGRAELLYRGEGRIILRDYAHTPDALERILVSLRRIHRGRLIVLFGCGGDRDAAKRPRMGKAAARWAHHIILTDDNPRSEDSVAILRQILQGIPQGASCHIIPDRRTAILQSIRRLQKGDLLLLAGKGHETYQVTKQGTIPFDEREVVQAILESEKIPWKNCRSEK